jgi:hypothetical protein
MATEVHVPCRPRRAVRRSACAGGRGEMRAAPNRLFLPVTSRVMAVTALARRAPPRRTGARRSSQSPFRRAPAYPKIVPERGLFVASSLDLSARQRAGARRPSGRGRRSGDGELSFHAHVGHAVPGSIAILAFGFANPAPLAVGDGPAVVDPAQPFQVCRRRGGACRQGSLDPDLSGPGEAARRSRRALRPRHIRLPSGCSKQSIRKPQSLASWPGTLPSKGWETGT